MKTFVTVLPRSGLADEVRVCAESPDPLDPLICLRWVLVAPPLVSNCSQLPLDLREGHGGWSLAYKKGAGKGLCAGSPTGPPLVSRGEADLPGRREMAQKRRLSGLAVSQGTPHRAETPTWTSAALGLVPHGYSVNTC